MMSLIPRDVLTQHLIVEVLAEMFEYEIRSEGAAATSEFPRPDAATAGTQSVQTDAQTDSTTVVASSQKADEELSPP